MRQLDDDIIEKRMKEILQNLEKKGYAKYRIYDYLFYITKNEKYLDAILNGLQSWDDDIRYQALYTVEDVIINEDDNKWLKKIKRWKIAEDTYRGENNQPNTQHYMCIVQTIQ